MVAMAQPVPQMKSQGLQLSLKASYSLTSDWDLYGRAGLMGYRAESDVNGKIDLIRACVRCWLSVPNMPLMTDGRGAWYQWVHNVGNENQIGVSGDVSSVMAGISYRFGQ